MLQYRAYVQLHEIAAVLQDSLPAARERMLSHGAIEVGTPRSDRFDSESVARVVDDLVLSDEAQPLARSILVGFSVGLINVRPEKIREGRIPSLEDLLTRLVAAHRELALGRVRLVASACGS